jgi:hypothetical protein
MPEQLRIAGTEPPGDPPRHPDIDDAIERWCERCRKQKLAAEATAIGHAKPLELMAEAQIERYPFVEPETEKRKILVCPATRKARTVKAPHAKKAKVERECDEVQREHRGARLDGGRRRPATSVAPAAHSPVP